MARAGSDNDAVIVGDGVDAAGAHAFRWTQAQGMRKIADLLADEGVNLGGFRLGSASAVSADGSVIAGVGVNASNQEEAWIAVIGTGFLTAGPLAASLQSTSAGPLLAQQQASADIAAALGAAGQFARGGLDLPVAVLSLWGEISGSRYTARDDHFEASGSSCLAWQATPSLLIGGGFGPGSRESELAVYGGDIQAETIGVSAFARFAPDDWGLRFSLAAAYRDTEAEITRG